MVALHLRGFRRSDRHNVSSSAYYAWWKQGYRPPLSRKGNPLGLIKGVRKNPNMSPSAKAKAVRTLKAQARKRGMLPKPHSQYRPSLTNTVRSTVLSTILWYVGLLVIGAILTPYPVPSAFFSIIQILLLVGDLGDAEKSNRLLQNFIAAFVNFLIGVALNDPVVWGFASLVIITVIGKALKTD